MKPHAWFLAAWLLVPAVQAADRLAPDGECVIVLHGLGRTPRSMQGVATALSDAGYHVDNPGYDSREHDIEWLASHTIARGLAWCAARHATKVHFVTHSLGGILVRQYLQEHRIDNLGRIVMLSPPNQGSEITDLLKHDYLYRLATGPAGQQLGTGPDGLPRRLRPIPGEIGIITGNFSLDPWFSPLLPGEDDGKVSVASARLQEMRDFLVIDDGHTFIMRDQRVIAQILHFLRHGYFDHEREQAGESRPEAQEAGRR